VVPAAGTEFLATYGFSVFKQERAGFDADSAILTKDGWV
jgi:hypothetical protein